MSTTRPTSQGSLSSGPCRSSSARRRTAVGVEPASTRSARNRVGPVPRNSRLHRAGSTGRTHTWAGRGEARSRSRAESPLPGSKRRSRRSIPRPRTTGAVASPPIDQPPQCERREAEPAPVVGERVEECVRGRVARAPGRAEERGRRGEEAKWSSGRSEVCRWRWRAPVAFGAITCRMRSGSRLSATPSSRTIARWNTPEIGGPSRSARGIAAEIDEASATSAVAVSIRAPAERIAAIWALAASPGPCSATRRIRPAPRAAAQPASSSPTAPRPPVTRYVASARRRGEDYARGGRGRAGPTGGGRPGPPCFRRGARGRARRRSRRQRPERGRSGSDGARGARRRASARSPRPSRARDEPPPTRPESPAPRA